MTTPLPIPTEYSGIQFRSRLEARWAVFFDALGLKWQYEPEGYQLPSGWYLPDFLLPNMCGGTFIEIKPAFPAENEPLLHCLHLAKSTGLYVYMTTGQCVVETPSILFDEDGELHDGYQWCSCPACGSFGLGYKGDPMNACEGACTSPARFAGNLGIDSRILIAFHAASRYSFWNPARSHT